jgi:UDP-glucuronate 4-epimerase
MTTLVTGAAGFIGAYTAAALAEQGHSVLGLDNFNSYYDPALKHDRINAICPSLKIENVDIANKTRLDAVFDAAKPTRVVHLAAQAGVRHSIHAPYDYLHSNLSGFLNVLEACRAHQVQHLVFASTSSIYGAQTQVPFVETMSVQTPLSLYAATKGANELMAHAYAHLYGITCTALRFFTVYGAWGRPDMAPILFTRAISAGKTIKVFNHGQLRRDFTHVSDIVAGVLGALQQPPTVYANYNLGAGKPVQLTEFIAEIERAVGKPAIREMTDMQAGDMLETFADTSAASRAFGYAPKVSLREGIEDLARWTKAYYPAG